MRKIFALISTLALFTTSGVAHARGFDFDFSETAIGPIKLEVIASDDLTHRAKHLPKKLSKRGSSLRLNSPFSQNGKYGEKEISYLIDEMTEELNDDFSKKGIVISNDARKILRVTIEMAKPNRPTFNQLSRDPSLSYQSYGVGGAKLSAVIITDAGETIGQASYDYYSTLTHHDFRPIGTWSDSKRAFSRFSKKLSKKLAALTAASS